MRWCRGPLAARVEAFRRAIIPESRVRPVMEAAIAECRKRTRAHLNLPANESFGMELVKDKSWGAYNYYQGENHSKIEINTDMPLSIGHVLILGCHEGYPGHHVQGIYNERNFRTKGWAEYSVAPLYAPASPLNEGGGISGRAGVSATSSSRPMFSIRWRADPKMAQAYDKLPRRRNLMAPLKISQMHLDGEISWEQAITLIQKYCCPARCGRAIAGLRPGLSVLCNQLFRRRGAGQRYVDRVGGEDPDARWAAYEHIPVDPDAPSDLKK
jgi:hypothetical protein